MEDYSAPSALSQEITSEYGRYDSHSTPASAATSAAGIGVGVLMDSLTGGQSSSRFPSGKERAPEYQRSMEEHERQLLILRHQQQHLLQQRQYQLGHQGQSSHQDESLTMDLTSSGDMSDPQPTMLTEETMATSSRRVSNVNTRAGSSYGFGPTQHDQHQQQLPRQHQHHSSVHISTSSSSDGASHHHHHYRQSNQRQTATSSSSSSSSSRPSRNWSMTIQSFYYQNAALNAMIVACREHMESPEGQGGTNNAIEERLETND
ncbi:hypothetical protein FBU30_007626 [Linnemannia zychae]|nr:hypothetical protein FBU30_007626 [Linnemannia zychae]